MASSLSRAGVVTLLIVAACTVGKDGGPDDDYVPPPTKCETSYLTYNNFGEPFIANWCRGCHSVAIPHGDMRQDAPDEVNFDTLDEIQMWSGGISTNATGD